MKDEKGEILGITYTAFDITERKQIAEALRVSEEKYRSLFENARDTIYTHGLDGKVAAVNKAVEEYGFKRNEMIGKNVLEFVPKEYWPKLTSQFVQLAQGHSIEGEIEVVTPLGKRAAEYRSNAIYEKQKIVGAQTILRDITDKKQKETALKESQQCFKALFDGNPEAVLFVDETLRFININRRFTELFGYTLNEIRGKLVYDLLIPKGQEKDFEAIAKELRHGTVHKNVIRKRKDGSEVQLSFSGGPVVVDN